jgi:hypothetical protein
MPVGVPEGHHSKHLVKSYPIGFLSVTGTCQVALRRALLGGMRSVGGGWRLRLGGLLNISSGGIGLETVVTKVTLLAALASTAAASAARWFAPMLLARVAATLGRRSDLVLSVYTIN